MIDRLGEDGPVVQSVEFVYDSQNRWIAKSVDRDGDGPQEAVTTHFVYDDNQIILQIDGEGEVTNRYLWGPAVDQILADEQVEADGPGRVLWTLTDHLNTVRDLAAIDAATGVTSVVSHIVYDSFGRVTGQTDPTISSLFGFTGRPFDPDTGLQNNLNRWYDAEVGRWLSEDPIGFAAADANLYRYVGNEATTAVDPEGLFLQRAIQTAIMICNGEAAREAELNDRLAALRIKYANRSGDPFALSDGLRDLNKEQREIAISDAQMVAETYPEFVATAATMGVGARAPTAVGKLGSTSSAPKEMAAKAVTVHGLAGSFQET